MACSRQQGQYLLEVRLDSFWGQFLGPALPLLLHKFSEDRLHCLPSLHADSSKPHQNSRVRLSSQKSRNPPGPRWGSAANVRPGASHARGLSLLKSLHGEGRPAALLAVGRIKRSLCALPTGWHSPWARATCRNSPQLAGRRGSQGLQGTPLSLGTVGKPLMAERGQGKGNFRPAPWEPHSHSGSTPVTRPRSRSLSHAEIPPATAPACCPPHRNHRARGPRADGGSRPALPSAPCLPPPRPVSCLPRAREAPLYPTSVPPLSSFRPRPLAFHLLCPAEGEKEGGAPPRERRSREGKGGGRPSNGQKEEGNAPPWERRSSLRQQKSWPGRRAEAPL